MAKEFFTKEQYRNGVVANPKRNNFENLEGLKIDKLTVHHWAGYTGKYHFWWCTCSCTKDRYFKVNTSSLKRGVTGSCGCNYKNNGASFHKKENASKRLSTHINFTEFTGWNYKCVVTCSCCGELNSFDKANNARGFQCCMDTRGKTIQENIERFGYTYLGAYSGKVRCDSCGIERYLASVKEECPCHKLPNTNTPSAVYFLQERDNPWIKIGKSDHPAKRCYDINLSSTKVGYDFSNRVKTIWVKGYKAAYRLG